MKNAYIVRKPDPKQIVAYKQVCIRCGKEKIYYHELHSVPRPRPNTTDSIRPGNRLDCVLGVHKYYFADEVERNK